MNSILIDVQPDEIHDFILEEPCVIMDFWSEECSVCKLLVPELEKFAMKHLGMCVFAKFKVNDARDLVFDTYGIRGGPAFIAYVDGEEVDRTVGFYGSKTFQWMEKIIKTANCP